MAGTLIDYLVGWLLIPWRILREIYMLYSPPVALDETDSLSSSNDGDKTIDQRELQHWTNLAQRWWDPEGDLV